MLSKTAYLAFLQCPKRLWLSIYQNSLTSEQDENTQRKLKWGHEIDQQARKSFPDGYLIAYSSVEEMVIQTEQALYDKKTTIFQATVQYQDLLARFDILTQIEGGWHLIEVKSSTEYKADKHLPDVAFQLYLAQQAGLNIQKISIMHLNKEYQHPNKNRLFSFTDVTESANKALPQVIAHIEEMRTIVKAQEAPDEFIGKQCDKPYLCPFYNHCWQGIDEITVYDIPRLSVQNQQTLRQSKIYKLEDIPSHIKLPPKQKEFIDLFLQETVKVDIPAIKAKLNQLTFPIHFLDFETINYPIPVYPGCAPYTQVPFQYSCHILYEDDSVEHREFLYTKLDDPRPELIFALQKDIHSQGSIVMYSSFEKTTLNHLATAFPNHETSLQNMINRLWDQLAIFSEKLYVHYGFKGSNSLKSVLPVLIPDMALAYKNLEVANGEQAQTIWDDLIKESDEEKRYVLTEQLLKYCHIDTYAMLKIFNYLNALS